eukprot:scaffold21698_cov60-Phaeocystis_antarctica.AAC.2
MLITAMSRPPKPNAEHVPTRWPFTGAQSAADCGAASETSRPLDSDTPWSERVSPSHAAPGEHVPERPNDSVKEVRISVVAAVPPSAAKHMTYRKCPCMVRYRLEAPAQRTATSKRRAADELRGSGGEGGNGGGGEAAAIDSVATLGAGPAAAFVVAVPAPRAAGHRSTAVGIHHAMIRTIQPPAVVLITRWGDEWEEREQTA